MRAVLETERLTLRELVATDLDFVATMMGHPEVNHYYERPFHRPECETWLTRQIDRYRTDGHGLWLVLSRDSGTPVGQVGLMLQEVEGERLPEVGWLLHRPYWGRGYATEAGAAVRDLAWTQWKYGELISLIRPTNHPSRRVAERIGMQPGRHVTFHGFEHIVYTVRPPSDSIESSGKA